MPTRRPSTRRKRAVASSLGLAAPDTATIDARGLEALSGAITEAGGVVLAQYRDPVGGKPLILACLPVDRVEPTPYQRDASDTHVKRLMAVVEKIGLFLDPANPNAGAVLAYAAPLLLVAAAFQTVDSLQAVGSGLLRGIQDTRVPMLFALFSYWVVGLPVAWTLGFAAGWGGTGIWTGLALGLAAAALLLNGRFALRGRLGLLDR